MVWVPGIFNYVGEQMDVANLLDYLEVFLQEAWALSQSADSEFSDCPADIPPYLCLDPRI